MRGNFEGNRRIFAVLFALSVAFSLVGCGTPTGLTIDYAPSSTKTAQGNINVGDFKYSAVNPKTSQPMPQDVIRNTAMGEIKLDRDVSKFVRDAVFNELRFVGVKIVPAGILLTGDIEEFFIDDLGYSIDWTYRVKYKLEDKTTGKTVYTSVKTIQRKTNKFGNPLGILKENIKMSVEELLEDPEFIKAIN
ncbi:hypothetical protein [Acidovorax sp. SUPP2825]|uniref:hypothetical protein n=1 Tax=Acidovorax sp. SUPP2825 TaxID=2920879 RepID=UPI0023DE3BDC|nr:hypothetical protein [Acidovorax sp. SUPP2825]GKS97703.1 hypothetical protein AVAK2825_24230 [Acidovorax sp. SUPP2825]